MIRRYDDTIFMFQGLSRQFIRDATAGLGDRSDKLKETYRKFENKDTTSKAIVYQRAIGVLIIVVFKRVIKIYKAKRKQKNNNKGSTNGYSFLHTKVTSKYSIEYPYVDTDPMGDKMHNIIVTPPSRYIFPPLLRVTGVFL